MTIFIGTESDLSGESAALGRKVDMFRHVYRRDIEMMAIQPRLPGASKPAEFAFEGAR